MRFFLLTCLFVFAVCSTGAQELPERVQEVVKQMYGDAYQPDSVRKSEIPGLYEIMLDGNIVYLDLQREILLSGKVIRLSDYQDVTERSLKEYRRKLVQNFNAKEMVVYGAKNSPHEIYVFTDVDCHYCRLFHDNMDEINKLGIRVNYLFTPYRGKEALARAQGVWCSKNRQATLTRAKQGKDIPLRQCDTPIKEHMKLAKKFGVNGTPAIVLKDGGMLRGLREPKQILAAIQQSKR